MHIWTAAAIAEKLTPRQYEVLALVAQRYTSKEIALRLSLSPKTIDRHVEDIAGKLGVSTREEARELFLEAGAKHGAQFPSGMGNGSMATVLPANPLVPEVETSGQTARKPEGFRALLAAFLNPPPVGGRTHDLTVTERVTVAGQMALFSVVTVAAIVTVIAGIRYLIDN